MKQNHSQGVEQLVISEKTIGKYHHQSLNTTFLDENRPTNLFLYIVLTFCFVKIIQFRLT
jgi:hypothetical protein